MAPKGAIKQNTINLFFKLLILTMRFTMSKKIILMLKNYVTCTLIENLIFQP